MVGRERRRARGCKSAASAVFCVVVAALTLWAAPTLAYREFRQNTSHDFVRFGFQGGGVCAECHGAGGGAADSGRLFRWDYSGSDIDMCAKKCHTVGASTHTEWPSGNAWTNVSSGYLAATGNSYPPVMTHPIITAPYRCRVCHLDQPVTGGSAYADCLRCHSSTIGGLSVGPNAIFGITGDGYDVGTDIEVNKFFSIGSDLKVGLLSQHNIVYNTTGDLSSPADNECLKCHGTIAASDHPGGLDGTPLVVYPDDPDGTGALVAGDGIAPTNDYAAYQDFCLACHDGQADTVPPANIQFSGAGVPVVPGRDYNAGAPYTTGLPYFGNSANKDAFPTGNYFEANGHGRSVTGLPTDDVSIRPPYAMDLTCLAQNPGDPGPQAGCHSAHGDTNYALIEDSGNLGLSVDTAGEVASFVCLGCHDQAVLEESQFHFAWAGRLIHVGTNGSDCWDPLVPPNNMKTGNPNLLDTEEMMPMFSGPTADLYSGRQYGDRTFGSGAGACDGSILTCLTCHDPHGTAEVYQDYSSGSHTRAMLRRFMTTVDYSDPLCGYCHVP